MNEYSADIETSYYPDENSVRVWLWCFVDVSTKKERYHGYNLESLICKMSQYTFSRFLFHNLKFDGSYIINYLLSNGYKYKNSKSLNNREFSTIISDMRQFYAIKIRFKNGNLIEIWDSLKVLPDSVKNLAKSFKLDYEKEEIEHYNNRPLNAPVLESEIHYCYRDCDIIADCLNFARDNKISKMTAGSSSLQIYKKMIGGEKIFRGLFPILDKNIDDFIRKSYRGGFTWVHPLKKDKIIGGGLSYDVNSMYPWAMRFKKMPYGIPSYFCGKPHSENLWIARLNIGSADILKDHIPCIQIKGGRFDDTEYLTNLTNTVITITSIDFELICKQYDMKDIQFIDGYYFKSDTGFFDEFIDYFIKEKNNSEGAKKYLMKLLLNSLYGKFGTNPLRKSLSVSIDDGTLKFNCDQEEEVDSIYTAIACFVTAYARQNIINEAQKIYDRILYIDTDSMHISGLEIPNINIDDKKLGYFKKEYEFKKGKYLNAKRYIEEKTDNSLIIKCAGMPAKVKEQVNFDNFHHNAEFDGKLQSMQVIGGCALIERKFTIK